MSRRFLSLSSAALAALALSTAVIAVAPAAEAQGKHLARTDTNGDGKISLQEFLAARGRIFERIDADHDGQITKDEVSAFQSRMETAAAGAMIRNGKEGGGEGRGQIGRLAMLTETGPLTRARWDEMMTKRFQKLDTAGTGFITMDQMRPGRAAKGEEPGEPMAPAPGNPKS